MNEARKCELCGRDKQELYISKIYYYQGQDYDLVKCPNCGLVFVQPMPDLATIKTFYDEKYFESDFACGMIEGDYLAAEEKRAQEYQSLIGLIKKYKAQGKLLEIGCAGGSFLALAKKAGFEVEGIDISEWAVRQAKNKYQLKVQKGRLLELNLKTESYEVIFFADLLEHEPEPIKFLKQVFSLLKPGGLVMLKVPTYVNSIYYQIIKLLPWNLVSDKLDPRLLIALKVTVSNFSRFPPYHLFEFSPSALKAIIRKSGLRVVKLKNTLIIPEFLRGKNAGLIARSLGSGFVSLKWLMENFNLPGGHIIALAVRD